MEKESDNIKEEGKPTDNAEYIHVKKSNKKVSIMIITTTIILCLVLIFSIVFSLLNINNTKILSGISVMDIDISNLSKEEAIAKLKTITDDKLSKDISLKHENYETTINANQFNTKFDVEQAVNEAYNIGRIGNIVTNNYSILSTLLFKEEIPLKLYLDEEMLENRINDIDSKLPNAVIQNSYYIEGEELIIVKGTPGLAIQKDNLKSLLLSEIEDIQNKYNQINLPVKNVDPTPINVQKIRDEIYKEAKNAYIEKDPFAIHTHVNGIDFKISIEEAEKILKKDKKEYIIPLKITLAKKTIADLGEEAFPHQLGTYTTRYDASNYNRSNNLTLAANKINGTVIMPGEVFSYNQVVGERTIASGYLEAGAYAGGRLVQDVGGGICQISSTLYNAVLLANLEIVDRSNHCFETSYVPAGRDATVNWGTIDFQFKNTRKYPVKIVASAKNGISKIEVQGLKEEVEYEVVIQSKILSYIPYTTIYEEDKDLEEGKEVVEQEGFNGSKSETYKILKQKGKVVSQSLLSKDTYDPMEKIIRKGTKKKEIKPVENSEVSNTETNNENTNITSTEI